MTVEVPENSQKLESNSAENSMIKRLFFGMKWVLTALWWGLTVVLALIGLPGLLRLHRYLQPKVTASGKEVIFTFTPIFGFILFLFLATKRLKAQFKKINITEISIMFEAVTLLFFGVSQKLINGLKRKS